MRWSAMVILACLVIGAVALIVGDAAFAQDRVRGGPAPLLGVGLPLAGGVLVALMLARRFWRKD